MASMRNAKDGPRYAPGMTAQARRPAKRAQPAFAPSPVDKAVDKRRRIEQTMQNVAKRMAAAVPGGARAAIDKASRGYLKKAVAEQATLAANARGGARKPASRRAMAQVAYTQEENAFKKRNRIK
jgi:hypothetical protein